VPDNRWTWPLGGKEWPIGGSLGVGASVDYVFGSNEWPKFDIKPVEFDSSKFMSDLYADKAKAGSGKDAQSKGKWGEKNSKAADPPPKKPPVGNAKPGKSAAASPAKSKVQPGGGGKGKKDIDPAAKTASGKTVKQLQDDAVKKGKKPPGGDVKTGGKQAAAEKGKTKEASEADTKQALAALDQVTERYAKTGATKTEVEAGVKSVRRKFKAFKSLTVVDGNDTWDYEYEMSPRTKKKGTKKLGKKTELAKEKTQKLGGENVGIEMTVDWLDAAFASSHPGSPPRTGVHDKLMELLVTDPSQNSPDKYIRGHLLNENLGGEGLGYNLFPITGKANSQHLHSTEKKIKDWVKTAGQWVYYQVKVESINSKLDAKTKAGNYVNCVFKAKAILKDELAKKIDGLDYTIPSTCKAPEEAYITGSKP
jgi:hypothetical protein